MILNYRKLERVVGLSEGTRLKETVRRADKVIGGKEKVVARSARETRVETHDQDEYDEDMANFVFMYPTNLVYFRVNILDKFFRIFCRKLI